MNTLMTFKKCGVLLGLFTIGICFSQNIVQRQNGAPVSIPAKLQQHGISLTREGLVSALQSKDPEIRFLAAEQLAYAEEKDTIPDIRDALRREENPLAEVNMGYALAQLGDPNGFEALKRDCSKTQFQNHLRLVAARYLLDLDRDYCVGIVLDSLQNSSNPMDRMDALSLLPRFSHLSHNNIVRMRNLVLTALEDPTPAVRISAGEAISRIGAKSDEQYLGAAIDREGDDVVRSQLQSDLQRLVSKYDK